ncbi:MAG: NUDIX domain-containing protein, partial [Candidatus Gallimonas sp.]
MKLTETTVRKNYIYRGKIINVRCDDAELPDGRACKREMVEHPGGAGILCVRDGSVLLVRQYRYAYGEEIYEIPAGKLNPGEDPALTAQRELKEETGVTAKVRLLYTLYPTPGYT